MLKPRRANMFAMRASAPGLFSTRTESVCFTSPASLVCGEVLGGDLRNGFLSRILDQVERRRAGRDHREAVLARVDAAVDDRRRGRSRAPRRARPELVLVLDGEAACAVRLGERRVVRHRGA